MTKGAIAAMMAGGLFVLTAAAAWAGGPGRWAPGERLPHPDMRPPFHRFYHPPYPFRPYPWRGPMFWYPAPHPPAYWFGYRWPGYGQPPPRGTGQRCYHYFGQRYCVGDHPDGDAPTAGQTDPRPDFGTGPRLFDGH